MRISATELGREFAAVIHRVRSQGQSFLIVQDGEAVAKLEPLEASRGVSWRTLAAALDTVPVGDAGFASDLEEVQRNQPEVPASAWPS